VGNAVLTEKDLEKALGTTATPEQKLNYIRRWSDKELTYQAAIEHNLDKNEITKQTIENMKKEFLSVQFIQQEMGKIGKVEVSADEIQQEFNASLQAFTRREPVARVAKIVVNTKIDAWRVRDGLTAENFRARGETSSLVEIPPFDSIKFIPKSGFQIETWNTIFESRVMSITLPIAENDKYSIYLILGKENVGTHPLLEEVIEDITQSILINKQNKIVDDIYENLRNRYDYSYDREYFAELEKLQKNQVE
jgi:hypothetical protein